MSAIPQHIAIIMDGNGRWAIAQGKKRDHGHKAGAETAKKIAKACKVRGVKHLTIYAFSEENWERPEQEVTALMNLMRFYLGHEVSTLAKESIAVDVIGDVERLSSDIQKKIQKAQHTIESPELYVHVALSYGSRQELQQAAKKGNIEQNLYTKHIPDPDLLIRTGGEMRLSNFLLWQCAYTELYFTPVLWPDFDEAALDKALENYQSRERRYGKIT